MSLRYFVSICHPESFFSWRHQNWRHRVFTMKQIKFNFYYSCFWENMQKILLLIVWMMRDVQMKGKHQMSKS